MPATISHVFSNIVPDVIGTVTVFDFASPGSTATVAASNIVKPTNWNETHAVTLAPTGAEMLGGFSNGGNVSFGTNPSGFITASAPAGGGAGGVAVSAGTNSTSTGTVVFSNANNVTFGMNTTGVITASVSYPAQTTQSGVTTAGNNIGLSGTLNQNGLSLSATVPAQTNQTGNLYVTANSTQLSSTAAVDLRSLSFAGAGIASVGVSQGVVVVSVPSGGGAGDGVNIIRAGTTGTTGTTFSSISGTVNINGGNNITVSQDGSNNIVISAAQGGIAAGTQTATSGTLVFANGNGVTFGMSGSSQITASVAAAGGAQTGISSVAVSDTTYTSGQVSFRDGNNISFASGTGQAISITHGLQSAGAYLTTAMQSNAVTLSNINVSAGTTSNNLSAFTFSNGSGVSFGLNGSVITASVAAAGGAQTGVSGISAGTTQATSGTVEFANGNGVSFGMNGNTMTASVAAAGGAQTGISGLIASDATYTSGTVSFRDGNNITFASGTGQAISLTHNLQSAGAYLTTAMQSNAVTLSNINVSAGMTSGNLSALTFDNANGISFGLNAGIVTGSHNGLTTAAQSNHSHNFATTTTNGSLMVVATTNSAGATVAVPPYITTYAAQSNQTGNLYVTANSTQLSSTAGVDLRSLSFAGAGVASVGVSGGVVVVSVPSGGGAGDGVNIIRAGTTGTTGTTYSASTGTININGGNNITVSQDGSNNIVISAAQGGIAAGSQTATSGTLVFANSNNITFGMSGSSQITASYVDGGAVTISAWEPYPPIGGGVAFSTPGQNSIYLQRLQPPVNVAFANVERRMSGSFVSSTNSQAATHTYHYGLYSRGTGASTSIYSQIGSSQIVFQASISSNVSAGFTISQGAGSFTSTSAGTALYSLITGYKHLYMAYADTLTAGGDYAWAMRMSSATAIGTNALRIGLQELSVINNLTIGKIFATTAIASNASHVGDFAQGVYSATSSNLPSTIALSGLTNAVSQQRMYLQFDN